MNHFSKKRSIRNKIMANPMNELSELSIETNIPFLSIALFSALINKYAFISKLFTKKKIQKMVEKTNNLLMQIKFVYIFQK